MGFYGMYPPVIKHGLLENGPFITDFPLLKPPFIGDFPLPCLITGVYPFDFNS